MTAGAEVDRVIVSIDLRKIDPADALSRPFYRLQAEHGPGGEGQHVDFSRVILVDRAGQLMEHDEVYAHVLDSHLDVSMICVAIGAPDGDPTVAIRRPQQLGLQKAAILWVGDLDGIGWRMNSTLANQVNLPANGTASDPDRLPAELLEVLTIPQVFDEVIDLVADMPGNVASPGTRTIRGDIPSDILAIAQRSAIKQLTKEPGGLTDLPPLGRLEDALSPAGQRPSRVADVIRPDGRVDELIQRCRRASNSAVSLTRRVNTTSGFVGTHPGVRPALKAFAKALNELCGAAAWALDEADTHSGIDSRQRQNLDDVGIDLTEPPAAAVATLTTTLTEQVQASVLKCQPLPAIAERLRDEAESAAPRGTARYRSRLPAIASDDFLKTLNKPPAFISGRPPTSPGSGWPPPAVVLTVFVACLVSGAWPRPFGLYGGIAAIGAILIGILLLSRGAGISPGTSASGLRFLGSYAGGAVIGAGCGIGLSKALSSSLPAGLGAVITVVMLTILTLVSWRALAQRWIRNLRLDKVAAAPDQMRQLMAEAAREEWQLAAARTTISNHARRLASVLADAAATLRDQESRLTGSIATAAVGGGRRQSPNDQVSQELVVIDLAAGTARALSHLITAPGPGGLAGIDTDLVSREVTAMLDDYRVHLLTSSLHEPPPFGGPSERRAELVQSLVERGSELQNAIRYSIDDERITQLCSPHQLTLLETRSEKAELIRFAPRSAQGLVYQQKTDHDRPVSWTWASAIAGVLRLVPLRPGAVVDVISHSAPTTVSWTATVSGRQAAADAVSPSPDSRPELENPTTPTRPAGGS